MEDVCAVADLKPHEPFAVRAGNKDIVLALWRDEIFALRNICPHQGQSFVCGNVVPRLSSSAPGHELVADEENPLLQCPWHTWGFELRTGKCATEPSLRVRTYPVVVQDGRVFVDV